MRAVVWALVGCLGIAGCPAEPVVEPVPDAGASLDAPALDASDPSPLDAGGPTPDAGVCDCDDGIACTRDVCEGSSCAHEADHGACDPGSYCETATGCVGGEACATIDDCVAGDPCIVASCPPATRACVYALLDGDGDGAAPLVCGGGDCDDSTPDVGPSAPEVCDGFDQNCDGTADEAGTDPICDPGFACLDGACVCPAPLAECGSVFGTECVDRATSESHCGVCNRACATGQECVAGTCTCASPRRMCLLACRDLMTDPEACGSCATRCGDMATCSAGVCTCPAGLDLCVDGTTQDCVDLGTSSLHCGACDAACLRGASCAAGTCGSSTRWLRTHGERAGRYDPLPEHLAISGDRVFALLSTDNARNSEPGASAPVLYGGGIVLVALRRATGDFEWVRGVSYLGGVATDGAGALYVGAARGAGTLTLPGATLPGGAAAAVVAAVEPATGMTTWNRIVPGQMRGIAGAVDGVVLFGTTPGSYDFGGGALPAYDTNGGYVVRYDAAGAHSASWRVPGAPYFAITDGPRTVVVGTFGVSSIVYGGVTIPPGWYGAWFDASGTLTSAFSIGIQPEVAAIAAGDLVVAASWSTAAYAVGRIGGTGTVVWSHPRTVIGTGVLGADSLVGSATDVVLGGGTPGRGMLWRFDAASGAAVSASQLVAGANLVSRSGDIGHPRAMALDRATEELFLVGPVEESMDLGDLAFDQYPQWCGPFFASIDLSP